MIEMIETGWGQVQVLEARSGHHMTGRTLERGRVDWLGVC